MRRLSKLALVLILAGVAVLLVSTVAQGSDSYNFDVIFDDAHGLVSGQQVKIAGAVAGSITDVTVTANNKARVEATIKGPFQFHTNATCIIRPDGLIAENYLNCNPGSASKPLLRSENGEAPTVPVTQTSEPVNLQDLFDIFNLPTRERFQVLVDELGIGTAGNGTEINSILQRANPTLQAAQRVIKILDAQTSQISTAIDATDQIAKVGVNHTAAIQSFIQQASGLTQLTADHSSSLEQAINKLPAFLDATTPALKQLDTVATTGTPLLKNLRAATPSLNKIDNDIVPFTKVAKPALASLSSAVSTVIPDTQQITPLVATIANYLQASKGTTANFSKLLTNLLQHGFSENFLSVLYYVATSLGKYDQNSHMLSSLLLFPGNGLCATYSTTPTTNQDCNGHYQAQSAYTPERVAKTKTKTATTTTATTTTSATTATPSTPGSVTSPAATPGASSPATGASTATTAAPASGLSNLGSTVSSGVSSVLSGVGNTVNGVTSGLGLTGSGTSSTPTGSPADPSANQSTTTTSSTTSTTGSLSSLLNYLLK
jgi:phospholipid/cholesterol/gamma-HCH transport system substrate-binding protein